MKKIFSSIICIIICYSLFLSACSSQYDKGKTEVVLWELSDADMLNPINYTDAASGYILKNVFQTLIDIDFKTLEIIPTLAESRAKIETTPEGGMMLTYRIRPEARWDNGTLITAKDVEFTLKVARNPKVNNQPKKPYIEFISDIKLYEDDPNKFTLLCDKIYILAEASALEIPIIPPYIYDPKGLLKDFSLKQIIADKDIENNPLINEFATDFNSEKYMREKDFIVGSGAYKLAEWKTGQRIVLEKKQNWWGDSLAGISPYFQANASRLIYQTINDQTTAIVTLKAGNLDVMRSIKPKDFHELPNSAKFRENFNAYTPMQLSYTYLGLNTRIPEFSDKRTRQALSHLVDVEKILNTVNYNYGERVIGPLHPSDKKSYHTEIAPYKYDIEKAKQLLSEAGWKDTDSDGVLDNIINGEKIKFNIDFIVNAGNDTRKQTALIFQEAARQVGIEVNVVSQDWSVYLDNMKKHKFEMYYGGWITSPTPDDPKQLFHTESASNEGSNYVSFGNTESDALIDAIRAELDEDKRAVLYKKLQEILHEEAPYIFLFAPTERIVIHKRFSNAEPSLMKPGYWEAGFKLANSNSQ